MNIYLSAYFFSLQDKYSVLNLYNEHMFIIFAKNLITMSPRPKRHRKMGRPPFAKGFKPFGTRGESTPAVILLYEEYEAIKLADYDGLSQEEAAKSMDVSRPTFTRIYESARKKIAKGLAESSMIIIEGGNVSFEDHWFECENCGSTFRKPIKDKVIQCIVCGS